MKQILQDSHVILAVNFIDRSQRSLLIKEFSFEYKTSNSSGSIVATLKDGEYSDNCRRVNGGIEILIGSECLKWGVLRVKRRYSYCSLSSPDKLVTNYEDWHDIPISVVSSYDPSIELDDTIKVALTSEQELVFIETINCEALRGEKGDTGSAMGVDYSLLTEQIIPGEFWLGIDGVRRQVYSRTFVGTTPAQSSEGLYFLQGASDVQLYYGYIYAYRKATNDYFKATVDVDQNKTGAENLFNWTVLHRSTDDRVAVYVNGSAVLNRPYVFTFKYTKR